jgi:gliding motility-associated-like protein
MHFANISIVDPSTSITSYLWVFGDGSASSSLQNPVHKYTASGIYSVTLVATTADLCSDAANYSVKVFDPPPAIFTISNTCLFDSALITNASLNPLMGTLASWSWDFGDGSPLNSTTWSPAHLYSTPGNYQITLITVSSNLGCPDTLKDSVSVFPMPIAKFSYRDVCLNEEMNFYDSSIVSSSSIVGWSWNFGDNSSLNNLQNPSYTYANAGTYLVTFIVSTNNGCKDTISKSVVVHPLPVAQFSSSNVCDGTIVQYTDLSSIPSSDTILSWQWNFGDLSPLNSNASSTHLYGGPGSYTVKLLIHSSFGCSDSIVKISVVNPNPYVVFQGNDTNGCEPLCISFQDNSTIVTGGNVSWLWNFGDGGSTSTIQNTEHCYTSDSVFAPTLLTVSLKITSDSGCATSVTKNNYITVYPNPIANFTVQPEVTTIIDPVISIVDASIGTNFWNWNFGDQDTVSLHNPLPHTYADTGSYIITLITSTIYNCLDTTSQTIIIEPDFVFYIPNSFTPNDDGVNDSFSGKGIFIRKYEMRIFDRWGNLIFVSDDINKEWDGKANHGNEIAEGDVYIYSINITDFKKGKHSYKGIVTIIR